MVTKKMTVRIKNTFQGWKKVRANQMQVMNYGLSRVAYMKTMMATTATRKIITDTTIGTRISTGLCKPEKLNKNKSVAAKKITSHQPSVSETQLFTYCQIIIFHKEQKSKQHKF